MAITKMDEVLEAIQKGKTNDEIRDEIDGRLSDRRIDVLRAHPAVRGGSGMKKNNKEISANEEIEREVEKIFSPDSGAADEPPREETEEQAPEESSFSWSAVEPTELTIRAVSCKYEGEATYIANTDGIWVGKSGESGLFIEHERIENFLREIAFVAGEHDRLREPDKYIMRCI